MDIKIVYTPYNFFTWAKQNNIIPENSFLVCAQPAHQNTPCLDDKNHYFVINDKLNEGQQTTQVITEVAGYLSTVKANNIQDELSALMANWLLFQSCMLNDFSYDKNNKIFTLYKDFIHPIVSGLNVIRNKGTLAADILVYIGEQAESFGDFYFKGCNTEEHFTAFVKSLPSFCDKNDFIVDVLKRTEQDWLILKRDYSNFGFLLSDYNFTLKNSTSNV